MTTNQLPTDPTQMPCGPDRMDVDPLHLRISQTWSSGSTSTTHLMNNADLGVILSRGQEGSSDVEAIPHLRAEHLLVIALGVDDGELDAVHYDGNEAEEALSRTIESLVACLAAQRRAAQP